jgi:hypothetical protein
LELLQSDNAIHLGLKKAFDEQALLIQELKQALFDQGTNYKVFHLMFNE